MDTQELIADFLVDGLVTIEPASLGAADHAHLYDEALALYDEAGRNGRADNHLNLLGDVALRARIPALDALLSDPSLVAALEALLGEGYLIHPHCYLHDAGDRDQVFHQDGNLPWNERGHYRTHRPDWALMFYYPQQVTLDNGPTDLVPGSQYFTKNFEKPDGGWHRGDTLGSGFREIMETDDIDRRDQLNAEALKSLGVPGLEPRFLTVPAGTIAICNYDIVHRGSRQNPGADPRFMFKFYFARTRPPVRSGSAMPARPVRPESEPVVSYCADWLLGEGLPPNGGAFDAELLLTGREDQKVATAYQLAEAGDVATLAEAACGDDEAVRRASAYGLRAAGALGVDALLDLVGHASAVVRRPVLFALGNAENAAEERVVAALVAALQDPDDLARSNAAYALGQVARGPLTDAQSVMDTIVERLQPGVESDNTDVAGLSRSTVRQSLAYAAIQLASNHEVSVAGSHDLTVDGDRYVAGYFASL